MADRTEIKVESEGSAQTILVSASSGLRLSEILRRENLPLNTRCGERGLCDGCLVELVEGRLRNLTSGQVVLSNGQPVTIKGCEHCMAGSERVAIRIAPRSLLAYEPQVVTDYRVNVPVAHNPLWQRIEIDAEALAPAPTTPGLCNLVARRLHCNEPVRISESVVEQLQRARRTTLRASVEFRGDHWLVTELSADERPMLGVAIDIGTTTVALLLLDLSSGEIVGRAAGFNKQMHLGDDVVTRINLCSTDPHQLPRLQRAVVERTIGRLLEQALKDCARPNADVACFSIAGNSTMLHLFAGVDPSPMGVTPFTAGFLNHRVLRADSIGLESRPEATVHLLPGAAAYIGADISAGVFSSGLVYDDGPNLLVDIGTNGEIVLKHGKRMLGCATAAGPAFEGAGLEAGLRAGDGAISRIRIKTNPFELECDVIGHGRGAKAAGLCGSAYIDFLSEARRVGLLSPAGRFERDALPDTAGRFVSARDGTLAFRIADAAGRKPIVVSERDVSKLLQAKAAIAAGILTLLHNVGIEPAHIQRVYLAGGFGMHLNVQHAIACGLLPGFAPEQIQVVGNTSLAGAHLAMMDAAVIGELEKISRRIEVIELNLDPSFQDCYIDQLALA